MRLTVTIYFATSAVLVSLAVAGESGLQPRPSSSDYPVSKTAKEAAIGALLAPGDQVKKILPDEISRKYVVVEVAIFPQDGSDVDVTSLDFALKFGPDDIRYPSTPHDLAGVWKEKQPSLPSHGPEVHGETGVTYGSGNDPVNGRTRGWSTYEGVAVSNGHPSDAPPVDAPPPPPPYDPYVVEARAKEKALPEGQTSRAVAGYLYFPRSTKKRKNTSLELRYSKDGDVVTLSLPVK
jgi:hypothetical protein